MNNNLSNNAVDKENAIGENIDEKAKEEKPIAPKMNTMTRKLVLSVVQLVKDEEEDTYKEVNADKEERNRVYKYLRDGMEAQNKALNEYMSALYIAAVADISKDDRKELNHLYSRISTSKLGSAYDKTIQFAKGLPAASSVARKAQQDFSTAMKKGLRFGTVALPTYRKDAPLLVHVDYVRLRSSNPHIVITVCIIHTARTKSFWIISTVKSWRYSLNLPMVLFSKSFLAILISPLRFVRSSRIYSSKTILSAAVRSGFRRVRSSLI